MIVDYIIKTNGDFLGMLLFFILILYFYKKKYKTKLEFFLLLSCIIALFVDSYICINTILTM